MKASANAPCPCGTGKKYKGCCGRFHGGEPAPTPEALMRSRYSAYAIGDTRYLVATVAPHSKHWRADTDAWRKDLARYCAAVRFAGLRVLESRQEGDAGRVNFEVAMFHADRDASFGEHSTFVRVDGRWLYVDEGGTIA